MHKHQLAEQSSLAQQLNIAFKAFRHGSYVHTKLKCYSKQAGVFRGGVEVDTSQVLHCRYCVHPAYYSGYFKPKLCCCILKELFDKEEGSLDKEEDKPPTIKLPKAVAVKEQYVRP